MEYAPPSDNSKGKKSAKEEKKQKGKKEEKMAPTVSAASSSPEAENLLKKISEQGDAVRQLKTSSAPKVSLARFSYSGFFKSVFDPFESKCVV